VCSARRRQRVGKTSVSYRLAHRYGVGITEIDDFQVILERLTTPDQQPAMHFWRTNPTPGGGWTTINGSRSPSARRTMVVPLGW
jgi:hypothetical protein